DGSVVNKNFAGLMRVAPCLRPPDITRVVAKRGHTLSKLTIHSGPRPAAPPRWRCATQDGVARRARCLTMLAACPEIAEADHRGVTPGRAGHATPPGGFRRR